MANEAPEHGLVPVESVETVGEQLQRQKHQLIVLLKAHLPELQKIAHESEISVAHHGSSALKMEGVMRLLQIADQQKEKLAQDSAVSAQFLRTIQLLNAIKVEDVDILIAESDAPALEQLFLQKPVFAGLFRFVFQKIGLTTGSTRWLKKPSDPENEQTVFSSKVFAKLATKSGLAIDFKADEGFMVANEGRVELLTLEHVSTSKKITWIDQLVSILVEIGHLEAGQASQWSDRLDVDKHPNLFAYTTFEVAELDNYRYQKVPLIYTIRRYALLLQEQNRALQHGEAPDKKLGNKEQLTTRINFILELIKLMQLLETR